MCIFSYAHFLMLCYVKYFALSNYFRHITIAYWSMASVHHRNPVTSRWDSTLWKKEWAKRNLASAGDQPGGCTHSRENHAQQVKPCSCNSRWQTGFGGAGHNGTRPCHASGSRPAQAADRSNIFISPGKFCMFFQIKNAKKNKKNQQTKTLPIQFYAVRF